MSEQTEQIAQQPPPPLRFHNSGDGPILHMAHANGFPPGSYAPLAAALHQRAELQIVALPARPLWPNSRPTEVADWRPLANDLLRGLERLGEEPIFGVGHSLGGVTTIWAAIERPERFHGLVLIDPVILPPARLRRLQLLRERGRAQQQPLVQSALRRRRTWPNREACFAHYRQKELFARWSDASLWAYVRSGTRTGPDGQMELVYPPQWEAHLFATVPLRIWADLPQLAVPTLIIRGAQSEVYSAASQRHMEEVAPAVGHTIIPDAGHLVAMERPTETAEMIVGFVQGLGLRVL